MASQACLALVLCAAPAFTNDGPAHLIADINQMPNDVGAFFVQDLADGASSSGPGGVEGFAVAGGYVCFDANDNVTCVELWGGLVGLVTGSAEALIDAVVDLDLHNGTETSLLASLQPALDMIAAGRC